jgi:hypothetical protein
MGPKRLGRTRRGIQTTLANDRGVPDEPTLRARWRDVPGYKFLVIYLERFYLELPGLLRRLPLADKRRVWAAAGLDHSRKSSAQRSAAKTFSAMSEKDRTGVSKGERIRRSGMQRPSLMLLTAAALLMDTDERKARRNRTVMDFIERDLAPRWDISTDDALCWSYVPRQVLSLVDVYANVRLVRTTRRGILEQSVRRKQERWWWNQLGLKRTATLTRQPFWRLFFPPLVDALLQGRLDSYRQASVDASRLVHLRYQDLWPGRPELVRKHHSRSL